MALHVLFFSDKQVRAKLFAWVEGCVRPLLVTATRHGPGLPPLVERAPFAGFEARLGESLDVVVLADEGTPEGMWRDPLGDLAEHVFPESREQAYQAASGYLLFLPGRAPRVLPKRRPPEQDVRAVAAALAEAGWPTPPGTDEEPTPRPRVKSATRPPPLPGVEPDAPRVAVAAAEDAWGMLGLARGCTRDDAKRAFRTLIQQYHPDKVAHLAPEFRELAERRTRELLAAWEEVEAALDSSET